MQMIADIAARTTDGAKATFYPDHLHPPWQSTLAVLADLDIRHEIDRDYLEQLSGPDEVRRHLVAELEAEWQRAREPLVLRLQRSAFNSTHEPTAPVSRSRILTSRATL